MAESAADTKAAVLSDELREFALAQSPSVFPKNFFCASCGQLAIDSWKLLCCNKAICSECHARLEFPTTCPLCDHSPLEADTCTINKSLRNTMRVWLDKRRKKEAKDASKTATPPADVNSVTRDMSQAAGDLGQVVGTIESGVQGDAATGQAPLASNMEDMATQALTSAVSPTSKEASVVHEDEQRRGSTQSLNPKQSTEPILGATNTNGREESIDGSAEGTYQNNGMFNADGMSAGPMSGYGFNSNMGNFGGMGFNGMNPMGNMPNNMGSTQWQNMNPMGMFDMNQMSGMPNGMYGGFGGNMGIPGMNDMSMMNYGGTYGNWGQGHMGGAGYGSFNGYNNPMGGYDQPGPQYSQMQYPKNNFQTPNRFSAAGEPFLQQKNMKQGSFGTAGSGSGSHHNTHSRPGSRAGPSHNVRRNLSKHLATSPPLQPRDDLSNAAQRDGNSQNEDAEGAGETKVNGEHTEGITKAEHEGKMELENDTPKPIITPAQVDAKSTTVVDKNVGELTRAVDEAESAQPQDTGFNQIQTVESIEEHVPTFSPGVMDGGMQSNPGYAQGMGNEFSQQTHVNGSYGYGNNGGYQPNHFGVRGTNGFNAAYGAATVLTGEPRGLGVQGAPTGPRAMREGRPNTGFSSRAANTRFNAPSSVTPLPAAQEVAASSPTRHGRASPKRDDTLRTKDKSPSRSRSSSKSRVKEGDRNERENRERSRSVDREDRRSHRDRSNTPVPDKDHERRNERQHHRATRHDTSDERIDAEYEEYSDRVESRDDRENRSRTHSEDSRHRSRRDKEKHRSSRSHRERSRERRHRHRSRSRSRSAIAGDKYDDDEGYANGTDQASEHSSRHKKDKYRDRSRDRDRDRDRRDRRDRDYEHEKEKDRLRDKDRDRKRSRRDREVEEDERDYIDEKHRSSRRNARKDRDKDRDRERERDRDREERSSVREPLSATSARHPSPPLNAPTGPAAESDFSIRGFSKSKGKPITPIATMPPPPTGPRALQPPTGPRDRSRDHRRAGSASIPTPTTPNSTTATATPQDHYAAERERNIRERERLDRDRVMQSVHSRATPSSHSGSRPSLSSKRSRDEIEREDVGEQKSIPTGPRNKRRKSGEGDITNIFTAGLRKAGSASGRRRGGVKMEGDVDSELERVERERDGGRRW